ncbi:uncharacterized protein LOC134825902 [Bolinopsis microptera]|uniref:uncharacterized protein LOC134825902 n=1 Tax=Bolinopsis microptera TaxID=2820187 RepID=UPI00307A5913
MRAIIFLAIVGVAFGNLCQGVDKNDINAAFATARVGSLAIFGKSCPGFDFDTVAFSDECRSLVRQATCYGLNAASHYDSDVVSYKQLAVDVPNMEKLGNLACEQARGCFLQVSAAMEACEAENVDFVQDTIDAAEIAYKDRFEDKVAKFAKASKGSLLGDLASMAIDRFSSADDIQDFIEEHLTKGVKSDASAAAEEAQALAKGWCDDGCTSDTASFLRGIFRHMNNRKCDDASEFCGECQSRAASYFARNQLPCCIEKVVRRGIVAYDYVIANYSDALESYGAAVKGGLSVSGLAEAEAIRDRVVEEFSCVSEVYSANRPECV